jgi:hypothetical protein
VDVVVDVVLLVVVGSDVVVSATSATLQALTRSPTATNLASVVRIGAILRRAPRIAGIK